MRNVRERRTSTGSRRYHVEIRIKGAPPVRRTFRSKVAAREWRDRIEREVRSGALLPLLEASRHTVGEAIDRYLEDHLQELKPGASRQNRRGQLAWWRRRLGPVTLAQLSPGVVSDARRELLRLRSPATANRYMAALSRVLSLAARQWEWIERNPCGRIERLREPESPGLVLDREQMAALLAAASWSSDRRLHALVWVALTTALRRGEILSLRWEDVDLSGEDAVALVRDTKNGESFSVDVPGQAAAALRELARIEHITGYVFAGVRGRPTFPRTAWARAKREAGVPADFRFHDLKHTAVTWAAEANFGDGVLSAFSRHRSPTVRARYTHVRRQRAAQVGRSVEAMMLATGETT